MSVLEQVYLGDRVAVVRNKVGLQGANGQSLWDRLQVGSEHVSG